MLTFGGLCAVDSPGVKSRKNKASAASNRTKHRTIDIMVIPCALKLPSE
jgi:hypothetical protein